MEISTANQPPQVFDNKDMYNRIYIYYTTTCTTATNSWFLELPISIFECVCTLRIYIYICAVLLSVIIFCAHSSGICQAAMPIEFHQKGCETEEIGRQFISLNSSSLLTTCRVLDAISRYFVKCLSSFHHGMGQNLLGDDHP
jgi:hypothetical protein